MEGEAEGLKRHELWLVNCGVITSMCILLGKEEGWRSEPHALRLRHSVYLYDRYICKVPGGGRCH